VDASLIIAPPLPDGLDTTALVIDLDIVEQTWLGSPHLPGRRPARQLLGYAQRPQGEQRRDRLNVSGWALRQRG